MASFAELASVTASTKRSPGITNGLEGAYVASIASLKCLPLDPVDPELAREFEGLTFRELLQTSVEGGLDIVEGDTLTAGSSTYPIRSVAEWYWPPDDTDYMTLILEDRKP